MRLAVITGTLLLVSVLAVDLPENDYFDHIRDVVHEINQLRKFDFLTTTFLQVVMDKRDLTGTYAGHTDKHLCFDPIDVIDERTSNSVTGKAS